MRPMQPTRTAEVTLHDGWCVVATIRPGVVQSLDDARENLATTMRICGGARRPLMVDISKGNPLEPEVRHFYTGEQLVASFKALALVVESTPLGYVIGNIYLRVARPGIPTQLFASRDNAFDWLRKADGGR
jgi:hypothetical protein